MMADDYTNQQQWGYAALSVSIITLTAIFGLVLIPLAHKRIWIYVQDFLLALATATLLCDAILHLLPHGLGLHADHQEEGHAEHDDSDDHDERVLNITNNGSKTGDEDSHAGEFILVWKLNVMVITFYLFWVYTIITKHYGHGHSHKHENDTSMELNESALDESAEVTDSTNNGFQEILKGIPSSVIPPLIGDITHNFADGIAIAAGFGTSVAVGVGTSIAVLFHELPHELGDFALYVKLTGSYHKALLFNLISALFQFAGLAVGFAIVHHSSDPKTGVEWLQMVVAGVFIYVAICQILPELNLNENKQKSPMGERSWEFSFWHRFAVANFGLALGWFAMTMIALNEKGIQDLAGSSSSDGHVDDEDHGDEDGVHDEHDH